MKVLGVMSGTSLDGLDLALVEFKPKEIDSSLEFDILAAETYTYDTIWQDRLANAATLSGKDLTELDRSFGRHIGEHCKRFLQEKGLEADLIASHGHTVFHEPEKGYTLQIGNGSYIAQTAGISTAYDFRSQDLAQGGQGAPLVPIGDLMLFGDYDCCVNLGGIANLSKMRSFSEGMGYDVCPFNILLNHYSQKLGAEYDADGAFAKEGLVNEGLLEKLEEIPFYAVAPPKSLDKAWILDYYIPIIDTQTLDPKDVLATLSKHFSKRLSEALGSSKKVLFTGGGAYNSHFINQVRERFEGEIVLPSQQLIEFKEALIFALLGYLKSKEQVNVLSVITGGKRNLSSGILIKHSK